MGQPSGWAGVAAKKGLMWVVWYCPREGDKFPGNGEGKVKGERACHNSSFWVLAQNLNLDGPVQSSVSLLLSHHLFHYHWESEFSNCWVRTEEHFSLLSWVSPSQFYLCPWEDPSWHCLAGFLIALLISTPLWILLLTCCLFSLRDPEIRRFLQMTRSLQFL